MAKSCSHETSKLTCSECSKPICSNCLVQCPVGFRCQTCTKTTKVDANSSTPLVVTKQLLKCIFVGFTGGWVMPFITVPFFSCLICFFMGLVAGRWLAGVLDHRIGHRIGKVVSFGILIGMSLSPLGLMPFGVVDLFQLAYSDPFFGVMGALTGIANMLFCPICFFVGVMRPTVWGERF